MIKEGRRKGGRAKSPVEKLYKRIHLSISPPAYKKFIQIPKNERSRKISTFLERCNPYLVLRNAGEHLVTSKTSAEGAEIGAKWVVCNRCEMAAAVIKSEDPMEWEEPCEGCGVRDWRTEARD